jgi:heat shock protein 4
MSVFGIDFGTESSVVAIARRGGVDVCVNEVSNRQTRALVSFGEAERYIGESGANQLSRNPGNTVSCVKRLLGHKYSSKFIQEELKTAHYKIVKVGEDDVGVEVNYADNVEVFTPVQLAAMLLGNLKDIAAATNGAKIKDACIGVPSYWTDSQRSALLDAAEIAGLTTLRLINETSAAALQYGIPKSNDFGETDPTRIVFFDLGFSSINVALAEYRKGKVNIISVASDPFTGGRDFDRVLFDHFAARFEAKNPGCVVRNSPKAILRLMVACEKCKKVLSANAEATINVESLLNDRDLGDKITRDEFAQLATPLYARLLAPVHKVLEDAKLQPSDIKDCELMGGSSRMPVVFSQLSGLFGKDPSRTLNQEECIARGAAFMAAMLSPAFRVRDFAVHDITPYPVKVEWTSQDSSAMDISGEDGKALAGTSLELFGRSAAVPKTLAVQLKLKTPSVDLAISYSDPSLLVPGTPVVIGTYHISGVRPRADGGPGSVKIKVKCDADGVTSVDSAQLFEEHTEMVEEIDSAATDAAAKAAAELDPPGPVPEPIKVKVPKTVVKRIDLAVEKHTFSIPRAALNALVEREANMAQQDRIIRETADRRNAVESYVYDMRDRAEGDLKEYFDDESRAKFLALCSATEEWLYNDGSKADRASYVSRLAELEAFGKPAVRRFDEEQGRKAALKELTAAIAEYRNLSASTDEKYEHIDAEARKKVTDECNAAEQWLSTAVGKFEVLMTNKARDPAFTCAEVIARAAQVKTVGAQVMNKPKPKEAPKPAEPKKDEAKPEEQQQPKKDEQPKPEMDLD